jgi:hypothetical protein
MAGIYTGRMEKTNREFPGGKAKSETWSIKGFYDPEFLRNGRLVGTRSDWCGVGNLSFRCRKGDETPEYKARILSLFCPSFFGSKGTDLLRDGSTWIEITEVSKQLAESI